MNDARPMTDHAKVRATLPAGLLAPWIDAGRAMQLAIDAADVGQMLAAAATMGAVHGFAYGTEARA